MNLSKALTDRFLCCNYVRVDSEVYFLPLPGAVLAGGAADNSIVGAPLSPKTKPPSDGGIVTRGRVDVQRCERYDR